MQPPKASGRRFRRIVLRAGAVAAVLLLIGVAWLLRDPEPRMRERRSRLAGATVTATADSAGYRLDDVTVRAASGLEVELTVKAPLAGAPARRPLVVLLGGHFTGRNAVRLVEDTRGVIVAAVSYPYRGDPRPYAGQFVRDIPKMRAAFLDTPPALQLALDYLLSRPDVDPARVEAVGVSLGAPFVVIAAAMDARFTRVWSIHGSGGSFAPLEANMRPMIPVAPVRWAAAGFANVVIAGPRLAPDRWVGRISPRPFVMLNARDDQRLPPRAVQRLYDAAGEPRELVWLPGGHVRPAVEVVRPLVDSVLARTAP